MHQVGVLSLSLQYAAPLTDSVSEVLGEARVRQVSVAARATDSVSELLEEARSDSGRKPAVHQVVCSVCVLVVCSCWC